MLGWLKTILRDLPCQRLIHIPVFVDDVMDLGGLKPGFAFSMRRAHFAG